MKSIVFLILLIFSSAILHAQMFLVMKNGDRLEISDTPTVTDRVVKVKSKENGKQEFKLDDIDCYYDLTYESGTPHQLESVHYPKIVGNKIELHPSKQILDGEISLYREVSIKRNSIVNASNPEAFRRRERIQTLVTYYAEKEGNFRKVLVHFMNPTFLDHSGATDENLKDLKSLMSDKPEAVKAIESSGHRLDEESLIDIIKDYNISKFTKPNQQSSKQSSVFFYSKMRKATNEDLTLTLNDSVEVKIPAKKTVPIRVPIDLFTKVCAKSATQSDCLLITGSPYFIKYYEVDYNPKRERLEIKPVHSMDAQNYLRFANSK